MTNKTSGAAVWVGGSIATDITSRTNFEPFVTVTQGIREHAGKACLAIYSHGPIDLARKGESQTILSGAYMSKADLFELRDALNDMAAAMGWGKGIR